MDENELVERALAINGQGEARLPGDMLYTREELGALARAALAIPNFGRALEIGVYVGRSTSILLNLQAEKDLDIVLVDAWGWNVPISRKSFDDLIREQYPNTPFTGMWMSSERAWNSSRKKSFDYIHIDGDHDELPVRFDVDHWVLYWLRIGGLVCLHDYDCAGVKTAVDDLIGGWPIVEQAGRTLVKRRP